MIPKKEMLEVEIINLASPFELNSTKIFEEFLKELEFEILVRDLSEEEIKTRLKKISYLGSLNIEYWYLDDQLLFETEIIFEDNVYKWKIRRPKETQEVRDDI